MPAPTEITVAQLSRLIGLPGAPALLDVRLDSEYRADPRLVPAAQRHCSQNVSRWCKQHAGRPSVVVCQNGGTLSQATAAPFGTKASMLRPWLVDTKHGARSTNPCFGVIGSLTATVTAGPYG